MKDDNAFLSDLSRSRQDVNKFAEKLRLDGFHAWLPPERTRPDSSVRGQYADDLDIMLQGRIEHKVRTNIAFTCRDDFPYDTVIVDEVYKENAKASHQLLAYVIENPARTHAAIVYGWTRAYWLIETRDDPKQRRACDFYTVPKRLVRFIDLSMERAV